MKCIYDHWISAMSECLRTMVTEMAACLSAAELTRILLKVIPERELRLYQPPTPRQIPGLRRQPRAGSPQQAMIYDPAYSALFPDSDDLEFLEEIRSVVLAQNQDRDSETLQFLLAEFETYSAKQEPDVPNFFHPILIVFKQWHERTHTNPAATLHNPESTQASNLSSLLLHMKTISSTL